MKPVPYLEVILAAAIWGSTGAFVKYLNLPATTMSFFRMGIPVAITLAILLFQKKKLFRGDNKLVLFASSINTIRMVFYYIAFLFTSIGNAVVILYTWPIFATIFGILLLKEKVSKRNLILLSFAFIGILILYINKEFSFQNKDLIGMTAMLIAAALSALTTIIFKKESTRYNKYELIFYQNIVGAIVFIPFFFLNGIPTIAQIGIGTTYAILIGVIAYGLFFSALKQLKASTASFLSYIEVISGVLFGLFLFKEVLTWNLVIGGILIIGSVLLIKRD